MVEGGVKVGIIWGSVYCGRSACLTQGRLPEWATVIHGGAPSWRLAAPCVWRLRQRCHRRPNLLDIVGSDEILLE